MKNFLKYCSLILCVLIFSCDDKYASLAALNKSPQLEYFPNAEQGWLIAGGFIITGEAKKWTPDNNLNYSVVLRATDVNNNFGQMEVSSLSNDLDFFINETPFYNSATVDLSSFSLAVRSAQATVKEFQVVVEDDWGAQDFVFFQITFVENRIPFADLNLQLVEQISENEYLLDASGSFDADNNLGGFIVEYEYIIDDVVVTIPTNQIFHVFNSGDHIVKLRCRDNDNAWSDQITTTITVP